MARQEVLNALLARGVAPHIAEGITNEINRESGFDPGINEISPLVAGSRGGFGLFQHTGPRRRELEAFAQEKGVPLDTIETQIDFALQELLTTEKRAGSALANTTTAEEAADVFKRQFLRPASTQGDRLAGGGGGDTLQETPEDRVHRFFREGSLSPANREKYIARFGDPAAQQTAEPEPEPTPQPKQLPQSLIDAFNAGNLNPGNAKRVSDLLAVAQASDDTLTPIQQPPAQPTQTTASDASIGSQILRQLGLTARAGAEGAASLLGIAADPVAAIINTALSDENKLGTLRGDVSAMLTRAGVPEPENATERIVQAASQALVAGGGSVSAARGLATSAAPVTRAVGGLLASSPVAQTTGAAVSGGAGQTTAELGGGPVAQAAASIIGGVGVAGGITAAQRAAQSNKVITDAAKLLRVSPKAVVALRETIGAEDFETAMGRLAALGDDAMLVDTSPAAVGSLDVAIQTSPRANVIAIPAIQNRAQIAGRNLSNTLDDVLGAPVGKVATIQGIKTQGKAAINQAYNKAYSTPIDYTTNEGRAIEELLTRLPKNQVKGAIDKANARLLYDGGAKESQIIADIAEDGTATFRELPNVRQLDQLKRAFDGIARDGTDKLTGQVTEDAGFARRIAQDIRNFTRAAVPEYGDALKLASDDISTSAAVDNGYALLTNKVTRDVARNQIKQMTAPEKTAAKQGVRDFIDDSLARIGKLASRPDVEVREVAKALSLLSSRSSIQKLKNLVGVKQAKQITDDLERASIALNLRARTSANSQTFARQEGAKLVDDLTTNQFWEEVKGLAPRSLIKRTIGALTGTGDEAKNLRRGGLYAEIADVLVNAKGKSAISALKILRNVGVEDTLSKTQAGFIGRVLSQQSLITATQQEGEQ